MADANVKTGGTGDGDQQGAVPENEIDLVDGAGEDFQWTRHRREDITKLPLNPHALEGSFFQLLEGGRLTWHGVVVGQPQAKFYLLEFYDFLEVNGMAVPNEVPTYQAIVPFDRFIGHNDEEWRFYDDYEWMVNDRLRMSIQTRERIT